jgi:hypothetical protein
MRHDDALLVKCWLVALIALNVAFCSDDPSSKPETDLRHGFAYCGIEKKPTSIPVYEHPCNPKLVTELKCDEAVDLISREGPWLKIRSGDDTNRVADTYPHDLHSIHRFRNPCFHKNPHRTRLGA